jgi:hypothetical protein
MIAARPARTLLAMALLPFALGAGPLRAYDGEDMAPGLARLARLDADGTLAVIVVAREFTGRWMRAPQARLRLLPAHWQGGRAALEGQREHVVVAELVSGDGVPMYCELVAGDARPAGVCEEARSRLYYLAGNRPSQAP